MCLLLTLSRFYTLTQVNARCGWVLLRHFTCVSYTYLHGQQKQLSNHTKIDGTDGGCRGREDGCNNSIAMILFCDFHKSSLRNNNLRDMILSYDSINRRFPYISLLIMINCTSIEDIVGGKILEPFAVTL